MDFSFLTLHNVCAVHQGDVQYTEGCSVHWGISLSTPGEGKGGGCVQELHLGKKFECICSARFHQSQLLEFTYTSSGKS